MSVDISQFTQLLETAKDSPVCVALDWLSVLFVDTLSKVPEAFEENEIHAITDTIVLKNYGKGTKDYKTTWHVLYNGEHYATLLAKGRNPKFIRKGMVKVDFKNYLLYTKSLWPFYAELVAAFSLDFKNISRLDICIDGCNYLIAFLNEYVKQKGGQKVVELKGKRQRFSSNILDRDTMLYQNFRLGGGKKVVTIYNKSLDIVKTGKHYIQEYWKANGVVREYLPLEELAKTYAGNDDKTHIEGYVNLYRFEIRLMGECIKAMDGFHIGLLENPHWLVSIAKRHCQNFFEFVEFTRSDVSKCKGLDLIPYERWDIQQIELLQKKDMDDLYKTKLSIKKNIKQLYLGRLGADEYSATEMLIFDIENFDLQDWFDKRAPAWDDEFSKMQNDPEILENVRALVNKILQTVCLGTPGELLNIKPPQLF